MQTGGRISRASSAAAAAAGVGLLLIATTGAGTTAPWVNGGFELGDAGWTFGPATTFGDADGDGDGEAAIAGCNGGDIQLARGVTKGDVPATAHLVFDIEAGSMSFYSFRMILLSVKDPEPWANNLFANDPTGTVQPDWFDDQVLAWEDNGGSIAGHVDLDPVSAIAFNMPGWDTMTLDERQLELAQHVHMTIVLYGCGGGGPGGAALLDDFGWEHWPASAVPIG